MLQYFPNVLNIATWLTKFKHFKTLIKTSAMIYSIKKDLQIKL